MDAKGNFQYDAIVKQGHAANRIVHSKFTDLVPMNITESTFVDKPSEEDISKTTEKTREALEKIVNGKVKANNPKSQLVSSAEDGNGAAYIRYTPNQTFANPEPPKERIIRMIDAPEDPLEPSRFKHKRLPPPPPSPPAPVMHSPPRKVSVEDQRSWKIPPCVSNWKNPRGYTIPLDKRLAADGRGLQEVVVNDNFAKLSEALYLADRHAREEIEKRAALEKKLAENEKRIKEEEMRKMAMEAREKRSQLAQELQEGSAVKGGAVARRAESEYEHHQPHESHGDDRDSVREREQLRRERMKDRERELRLNRMGQDTKAKVLSKMEDRDISEKIALGIAQPTYSKDMMYDQRLFNQTQGVTAGFGDDDCKYMDDEFKLLYTVDDEFKL